MPSSDIMPRESGSFDRHSTGDLTSLDGFIEDLASVNNSTEGFDPVISRKKSPKTSAGPVVSNDLLGTNLMTGLNDAEVATRSHKFGLNQLNEEHKNHSLSLLMFFVGPIQFVMEVSDQLVPSLLT